MRQLTYRAPNELIWQDVDAPQLTADGDALVRPIAVTRCDLDRLIATGAAGMPGPFALGHETFGEVVDVGDTVTAFTPGDRVIVPFQLSCGSCGRCRKGLTALCESFPYRSSYGMAPLSGVEYGGGLSDLIRVPCADHMLVHVPSEHSPAALAGLADNVTNAYALVAAPLQQYPCASVLIVGGQGSGIGLHIAQCALALGADKVVFIDDNENALRLARQVGAEAVKLALGPDIQAPGLFPVTFDASGNPHGLDLAIRSTDYEGVCQRTYGDFATHTPTPLRDMYARNITLKLGRVHARAHVHATLDLVCSGSLKPDQVITSRVPFLAAAEAMLEPDLKMVFLADPV